MIRRIALRVSLLVFGASCWFLVHELRGFHYHDVIREIRTISSARVLLAVFLTGLGYLLLASYDVLGFRSVRSTLPIRKILPGAFIGFALSSTAGNTLLTGTPLRYRLYSALGAQASDVTRVILVGYVTFWLGVVWAGGTALAVTAISLPDSLHFAVRTTRPIGLALLSLGIAHMVFSVFRRSPIRVREWSLTLPGPGLTVAQVVVASLDWVVAALVLFVLLPSSASGPFLAFLGAFMTAQVLGLGSGVPGGLGVFDTAITVLLGASSSGPEVVAALLVYRAVYYILPITVAGVLLGFHEVRHRRRHLDRVGRLLGGWVPEVVPQVFTVLVLLAGSFLLFSGAIPAPESRLPRLGRLFPLPLIEASHFLASVIGVGLLVLARGLQRRLDAAWVISLALLAAGFATSLLRGLRIEEAAFLGLVFVLLVPCRPEFYRRAALSDLRWSAGWVALVSIVLIGTIGLVIFSYQEIEYSKELWWRFALDGEAPRAMRAVVGSLVFVITLAALGLLRPTPPSPHRTEAADIEDAWAIVQRGDNLAGHLALLGDKRFLFNDDRSAFVMYGVQGRTWVSMGDPIGEAEDHAELAWRFRELVDRYGGIPTFYQVREEGLGLYVDLGLGLYNIGEEARVPLGDFSLEGSARKELRQVVRRKEEKEGCRFSIVSPPAVDAILPRLRAISDVWRQHKQGEEKGFSLGFFRESYLRRLPIATVTTNGEIVAFANLWNGIREELSVDLMRYDSSAPSGVMDYLFTRLMLWGREQGHSWFNLGMAPLSGLDDHEFAPLWNRLGGFLFRHAEQFYNFQGLRQYKDKFDPVWQSRFVACPRGFALPRVLADITGLIGGGRRGVMRAAERKRGAS